MGLWTRSKAEHVDYDLAETISDLIWNNAQPDLDKVALFFQIYKQMPCYTLLHHVTLRYLDLSPTERHRFLEEVRTMLSGNDEAWAGPLTYSLWCDFFEDPRRVEETWSTLLQKPNDRLLRRILFVSGPVPFPLKEKLYAQLVGSARWHEAIYRSLLASAFEYFGDVDKQAAWHLLQQLAVPPDIEGMAELRQALASSTGTAGDRKA